MKIYRMPPKNNLLEYSRNLNYLFEHEQALWCLVTNGAIIIATQCDGDKEVSPISLIYPVLTRLISYIFEKKPENFVIETVGKLKNIFGDPEYAKEEECSECEGTGDAAHICESCECPCDCCDGTGKHKVVPRMREIVFENVYNECISLDANQFATALAALDIHDEEYVTVFQSKILDNALVIQGDDWRVFGMGLSD